MGDMAALVAPRPLYIEVGTDVEYKECEGHHQWFGSCYDWINKL